MALSGIHKEILIVNFIYKLVYIKNTMKILESLVKSFEKPINVKSKVGVLYKTGPEKNLLKEYFNPVIIKYDMACRNCTY